MNKIFEEFRWRIKTIGGIHNHDYWWKSVFLSYDLEWEDWWDTYCEGLHNLSGSFSEDGPRGSDRRIFSSIFGIEGERLFLKWLYSGDKKYVLPIYEWFSRYMNQKKKESEEEETKEYPTKNKNRRGYVYVLKSNRLYKIGRSKEFENRMKVYKTENPFGMKVILQKEVDDCVNKEIELLKKFEGKKHRGEWFKLDKEDIQWIKDNI